MAQYSDRGRSSGYNPGPRCCGGEDRNRALIGAGGKLEVEGSREECSEITGVECESGATLIPLWCQAFICSLVPGSVLHWCALPFSKNTLPQSSWFFFPLLILTLPCLLSRFSSGSNSQLHPHHSSPQSSQSICAYHLLKKRNLRVRREDI